MPYSGIEKERSWNDIWFYVYFLLVLVVWLVIFIVSRIPFVLCRSKRHHLKNECPSEFVMRIERPSDASIDQISWRRGLDLESPVLSDSSSAQVASNLNDPEQTYPSSPVFPVLPDNALSEELHSFTNIDFLQDEIDSFNVIEMELNRMSVPALAKTSKTDQLWNLALFLVCACVCV